MHASLYSRLHVFVCRIVVIPSYTYRCHAIFVIAPSLCIRSHTFVIMWSPSFHRSHSIFNIRLSSYHRHHPSSSYSRHCHILRMPRPHTLVYHSSVSVPFFSHHFSKVIVLLSWHCRHTTFVVPSTSFLVIHYIIIMQSSFSREYGAVFMPLLSFRHPQTVAILPPLSYRRRDAFMVMVIIPASPCRFRHPLPSRHRHHTLVVIPLPWRSCRHAVVVIPSDHFRIYTSLSPCHRRHTAFVVPSKPFLRQITSSSLGRSHTVAVMPPCSWVTVASGATAKLDDKRVSHI